MDNITLLGYLAGALTTIAFIPQLLKVIRTRSTRDISLSMFSIFSAGIVLWLLYGIFIRSFPIIAANAITIVFAASILFCKIKYK